MDRTRLLSLALTASLVLGALAPAVTACPNCKDSIPAGSSENTGAGDANAGLSSGFNTSIYLMLTSFVGVLGLVGYTLYRGVRGTPAAKGFDVLPADHTPPAAGVPSGTQRESCGSSSVCVDSAICR